MKIEIISKETIRPFFPTPPHLQSYRLSLLDQLAPPIYVPILLFYSADGFPASEDHITMYNRLKKSLAETLTRFYPLAGKINGDASVELHDEDVIFVRAHASIHLSKILENPDLNSLKQLLPLNPYKLNDDKPVPVMAAQLNVFSCGGIGIGVCISHKVADGVTLATFLNAWAETSHGAGETITPCLTSATLFPPKDVHSGITPVDLVAKEKTVTKRFVFDVTSLATLKAKAAAKGSCVDDPTRVEAVTALISMSAKNARRGKSLQGRSSMVITHVVNLRARTVPPLPEHAFGNIWQLTIAPIFEVENKTELQDLVVQLRRAVRKIDDNYVKKLQGEEGLQQASESMKEVLDMASKGEVEFYTFSSWVGFPFYETDFGWGRPIWVCISSVPIKNVVMLMSTRSGNGIEAWVTLGEEDMAKFENDQDLLQFAFPASSS
ncbi:stemmadenine O-acetyltransferase-like [Corylus avellana]|uniref:stemmadenine O-acetyltransferase-like n=1 Tax=Corylus avellana TaxID=13451 RepID=UPI001E231B30|nr:stemmadenine O-acetyltransferase-like [Corylus avellana]